MDFHDTSLNNVEMWDWQGEDYSLQSNPGFDVPRSMWDGDQNDDNFLDIVAGQTPIKDCTEFGYDFPELGDSTNNGLEECRDTSQVKRRRMLQFASDVNETSIGNEQINSDFCISKVAEDSLIGDGLVENLHWHSQWNPGVLDDSSSFGNQGFDQSSEDWLANCYNDNNMHCSSDEMTDYVTLDDQIDISEFCNIAPEMETDVVKESPTSITCKIFKGRSSYIKTPMKLTAAVAYPFTLIKPCGVQGDLTLKDINQRIHAPPPSRSKHKTDEDPPINYPTSAFSGKPVVVKTKIRTEGGKGSITIMRTRG